MTAPGSRGPGTAPRAPGDSAALLQRLAGGREDRLVHVEHVPARAAVTTPWPDWADPVVVGALQGRGIPLPWSHQAEAAERVWGGQDVVLATGTASGKSTAYLLPALTALRAGGLGPGDDRRPTSRRGATALYLAPTKALAADQVRLLGDLAVPDVVAATFDGDCGDEERAWAKRHATYLLSNPDMLHRSLLPGHRGWERFLRRLVLVVVDECHIYRGVFGSGVAAVLRRLRRVAAHYGADPVFLLASATVAEPQVLAGRLIGREVAAVTEDGSPRGRVVFGLWQPPLLPSRGERGAPQRRGAVAETADLLTDLVVADVQTLAFVRSRRAAEAVAAVARAQADEVEPGLGSGIAAYRGGFLPEERRDLERRLRSRDLVGVATTSALELGVDVTGVDAVLLAGWPGTRASLWQQAGRGGRGGGESLALFVARDEPLDAYFVHHPEALFGTGVEATVLDPDNPYVLGPHLAAAAAEVPLRADELPLFGPNAAEVVTALERTGGLRRRDDGWYWTRRDRAADLADLRGIGGRPVQVAEAGTGRLLGTVDAGAAERTVHVGAVYVHQGATFRVEELDLESSVALARREPTEESTTAREVTDLRVLDVGRSVGWADATVNLGAVEVSRQVVSYLTRRAGTGEVLGETPLDLPVRTLRTVAVWWTAPPDLLARAGVSEADLPGAAHAAEHASIGLLPLFATCDRWDIGGVSTPLHPDTGLPSVFVYDGHRGGAGFAERGFTAAAAWLDATAAAIAGCGCRDGCPACVQSPKCGNANDPLDKPAALRLLGELLRGAPRER